jgi:intermediate peptidase
MIRSISSLPLRPTYLRRLLASRIPSRILARPKSTVSGVARPTSYPPPPISFPTQDDRDLRNLFDRPTNSPSPSAHPTGLFDYPITSARSLRPLTQRTLVHAQAIVDRICSSASDPSESRKVVKNLDRLSDLLCGVIDMCELVRSVHPEREWVEECDLVYEGLSSFMNELNTHTGMYEVRSRVF